MSGTVDGIKKALKPAEIGYKYGDGSAIAHATRLIEDPTYRSTMEKLYGKDAVVRTINSAFEGMGPK